MAVTSVNLGDAVSVELPPQERGVPSYVKQELDHLERISFSFDMDRGPPRRGASTGPSSKPKASDRNPARRTGGVPSSHTGSQHLEPPASTPNVQQSPPPAGHGLNQNMQYPGHPSGLDPYTVAHLAALSALSTPVQSGHPGGNPYTTSADTLAAIRQLQTVGLLNPHASASTNNPNTLLTLSQAQGIQPSQTGSTRAASSGTQPIGQSALASAPDIHWPFPQSTNSPAFPPFPIDPLLLSAHQSLSLPSPNPFSTPTQAQNTTRSSPPSYYSTGISSTGTSDSQSSPSLSPEQSEQFLDEAVIAEDKRRRNTLASARFRIKKKHKTLTLERSVGELESRSEELEHEASELRQENVWLKEILILKSRNVRTEAAASSTPHALSGADRVGDTDDSSEGSASEDGKGDSAKRGSGTGAKDSTSSSSKAKGKAKEHETR